jgi:cold shock protein
MRVQGRIQFLRERYGFITHEGRDVFFHFSAIKGGEPKVGRLVSFELGETSKGPCAIDVEIFVDGQQQGAADAFHGAQPQGGAQ